MRKLTVSFLLLTCWGSTAVAQQRDPLLEDLIAQTNRDTLVYFVNVLTGTVPVRLGDSTYTITSRQHDHDGNPLAAAFLKQTLARFGLETIDHVYSATGHNVLGIQRGRAVPESTVVLSAHYDSRSLPSEEPAPGADDNASGTAAVLEAARLLSRVETRYTVLYALWDEEERGLVGSTHYALEAAETGLEIRGAINLDMIGYDGNGDGRFAIHQRPTPGDAALAAAVETMNVTYDLGLTPFSPVPATTRSDHAAFWNAGYSAILIIEHFDGTPATSDFNPFYHTTDDTIEHFNLDYFHALTRLAGATVASLALGDTPTTAATTPTSTTGYDLAPSYPNPFRSTTTISYELPEHRHVVLRVYDVLGRTVATLVDAPTAPGRHHVRFDTGGLPGGVYVYRLQAGAYTGHPDDDRVAQMKT